MYFALKFTLNSKRPGEYGWVPRRGSVGQSVSESVVKVLLVEECSRQSEYHAPSRPVFNWSFDVSMLYSRYSRGHHHPNVCNRHAAATPPTCKAAAWGHFWRNAT
ncbi:hypothetical protein Y032_0143g2357 [Ancylostoma ceylanicum]|nr:hypothetical protein Y032_0143g2357 [Ancylostoma ceylanicum]